MVLRFFVGLKLDNLNWFNLPKRKPLPYPLIAQAKGKSFWKKVTENEVTKCNVSSGIKPESKIFTFT